MEKHTITPKQIADGLHETDKKIDQANIDVLMLEVEMLISVSNIHIKYVNNLLKKAINKRIELNGIRENYIKFFLLN